MAQRREVRLLGHLAIPNSRRARRHTWLVSERGQDMEVALADASESSHAL